MGVFRDRIRQIAAAEIKNYINTVVALNPGNIPQSIVAVVTSVDNNGNATLQFTDGTVGNGLISTSRPIGPGSYVVVVGGTII